MTEAPPPAAGPEFDRAAAGAVAGRLPELAALKARLDRETRRDGLTASAVAAALALLVVLFGAPLAAILVGLLAALAVFLLYAKGRRAWTQATIDAVVPPVGRLLGDTSHSPEAPAEFVMPFEALGLVPVARHRILSHRIEGSRAGARFEAQHATLARSRGRRGDGSRLFHGLLLAVAVPQASPARLVVVPAGGGMTQVFAGVVRSLLPPSFRRIELGDPDFEARFHVLAAEPDAADVATAERIRGFLSPGFRAALTAIDEDGNGRAGLRAAFDGEVFLLALPRAERRAWGLRPERLRPFLDPGGLFSREPPAEALARMARDLALPHRIVDRLVAG